jgi:response regulator RpfG family c-di-GMP phosphodiesterase
MADSARTFAVAAALLKIADRYDALADRREIEERAAQADPEEDIPPN